MKKLILLLLFLAAFTLNAQDTLFVSSNTIELSKAGKRVYKGTNILYVKKNLPSNIQFGNASSFYELIAPAGLLNVSIDGAPAVSGLSYSAIYDAIKESISSLSSGGGGGISSSVSVTNFPATQVVSGTVSATISGTPTVNINGTVPVSGTVNANTGLSQPLTDTQLRASSVSVAQQSQELWTAGFSAAGASVLDSKLITPKVSTGVSYNQAAGSLNILSGTSVNAEFLTRSIQSFKGSMRMRFSAILSQRISNQSFSVLLADLVADSASYSIVNSTTVDVTVPEHGYNATMIGQFHLLGGVTGANGVPGRYALASIPDGNTLRFTVAGWPASGTGTLTVFGRNYVRNVFNGTSASAMAVDAQRNGWATGDANANVNTSNSPGLIITNELTGRDVFWQDGLRASATTPNMRTVASRYENIPDASVDLYVFIWCWNGAIAPASSTTFTLGHVAVEKFANNPVYIQGFRAQGSQNPIPVAQNGPLTINTLPSTPAGTNFIGNTASPLNGTILDIANGTITSNSTTGAVTPGFGVSYSVNIPVSIASGTNPTLDVTVEESDDNGTNWFKVYDFPRITATGIYRSPKLPMTGTRVRYVQTVGGTSPSFTRALNRLQANDPVVGLRQMFDRTVVLTTLSSATQSLNIQPCKNLSFSINVGAITTTAPALQLQVSDDGGLTWSSIGTPLTAVANSTVTATIPNVSYQLVRAVVTTAGVGVTAGYVFIKGF